MVMTSTYILMVFNVNVDVIRDGVVTVGADVNRDVDVQRCVDKMQVTLEHTHTRRHTTNINNTYDR